MSGEVFDEFSSLQLDKVYRIPDRTPCIDVYIYIYYIGTNNVLSVNVKYVQRVICWSSISVKSRSRCTGTRGQPERAGKLEAVLTPSYINTILYLFYFFFLFYSFLLTHVDFRSIRLPLCDTLTPDNTIRSLNSTIFQSACSLLQRTMCIYYKNSLVYCACCLTPGQLVFLSFVTPKLFLISFCTFWFVDGWAYIIKNDFQSQLLRLSRTIEIYYRKRS